MNTENRFVLELSETEIFTIFTGLLSRKKTDYEPANMQVHNLLTTFWNQLPQNTKGMTMKHDGMKMQLDYWGVLSRGNELTTSEVLDDSHYNIH